MARLVTCGFGLDTVGVSPTVGLEIDAATLSAACIIESEASAGSGRAMKLVAAAGSARQIRMFGKSANSSNAGFLTFYVKFDGFDATNAVVFAYFANVGGGVKGALRVTTAGKLQVLKTDGTQLGADSAALVAGRWYRIDFQFKASGTLALTLVEAYYTDCGTAGQDPGGNGTLIASGQDSATGQSWGHFFLGPVNNATGVWNMHVADLALNDDSGGSQATYVRSHRIKYLRPNGAGDSNTWATQVGGTPGAANNYTRVNETPPNDATSYNAANVVNQEDLYAFDNAGLVNNETILVVGVNARRSNVGGTNLVTAHKLELEKTSGGTKLQGPAQTPNATVWSSGSGGLAAVCPIYAYNDPDGAAWTPTTVDSLQAGAILTAFSAPVQNALTAVWVLVDYVPVYPRPLAPAVSGASAVSAAVVRVRARSAAIAGASAVAAAVVRLRARSAAVAGRSVVTVAVVRVRARAAAVAGSSVVAAIVVRVRARSAAVSGSSLVTVAVVRVRTFAVAVSGSSVVTVALGRVRPLAAAVAGSSVVTASLVRLRGLVAAIFGSSTVTATVEVVSVIVDVDYTLGGLASGWRTGPLDPLASGWAAGLPVSGFVAGGLSSGWHATKPLREDFQKGVPA